MNRLGLTTALALSYACAAPTDVEQASRTDCEITVTERVGQELADQNNGIAVGNLDLFRTTVVDAVAEECGIGQEDPDAVYASPKFDEGSLVTMEGRLTEPNWWGSLEFVDHMNSNGIQHVSVADSEDAEGYHYLLNYGAQTVEDGDTSNAVFQSMIPSYVDLDGYEGGASAEPNMLFKRGNPGTLHILRRDSENTPWNDPSIETVWEADDIGSWQTEDELYNAGFLAADHWRSPEDGVYCAMETVVDNPFDVTGMDVNIGAAELCIDTNNNTLDRNLLFGLEDGQDGKVAIYPFDAQNGWAIAPVGYRDEDGFVFTLLNQELWMVDREDPDGNSHMIFNWPEDPGSIGRSEYWPWKGDWVPAGHDLDISGGYEGCGTLILSYADYTRNTWVMALPTAEGNPMCDYREPSQNPDDTDTPDDTGTPDDTQNPDDTSVDTAYLDDTGEGDSEECGCSSQAGTTGWLVAGLGLLGAAVTRRREED